MKTVEQIIEKIEGELKCLKEKEQKLKDRYEISDEFDQCYIMDDIEVLQYQIEMIQKQLDWIKGS